MAGTVYTASNQVERKVTGTWGTIAAGSVLHASGSAESGLDDNGVAFGDEAVTSCTIVVKRSAVSSLTFARLPVRVTFTINAGSQVAFVGEVASWSGDLDTITWQCEGMLQALPGRTRDYYSPLRFRRPPATKTTVSSVEDPDNGAYLGGLINEVLWRAGGRPYEQAGSYASADFYYSLSQAIRAPDWSWVAGENGYEEIKRLVRAVGGQIYQGMDGVIYYRSPLAMVGTATKTYNIASSDAMDKYKDLSEQGAALDQYAASFSASYTPRHIQPLQEVINDTTIRVLAAGDSITIDLEPQWPLYSVQLDGATLKEKNITIAFFDGKLASYHASTGFTVVTTVKAMRITAVVTNNSTRAMQITKIVIQGRPITVGESGTVTAGSGDPARTLEDNIFVQTRAHAQALATMALSFHNVARNIRTLTECVYDTARTVGETVNLTVSELSLSATPHIILKKQHDEAGAVMTIDLVDATGLPVAANFWLCSSAAQTGSKTVGW